MSEQIRENKSSILNGIASVLNSCGSAVVVTYDAGAKAVGKVFGAVKQLPGLPAKAKGLVAGGRGIIGQGETDKLYRKIKEYEQQVHNLYCEIGKTSVKLVDEKESLQGSEGIQGLLQRVREFETNISELKKRIVDLDAEKKAEVLRREQEERSRREARQASKVKTPTTDRRKVQAEIHAAIKNALIHGDFASASDRAIFDKISTDLLDNETEIKMLAAAELGKMTNKAAVPVLHAAIGLADPHLTAEIINSLITIGDQRSVPMFVQCAKDLNFRVRVASLRGLYKLAPQDKEIRPVFIDALRDAHAETRKTAATLLGWLDDADAVPAMVQCLPDEDERVRKAVISALANIRDKSSMTPLIRRLEDENIEVREKALGAIRVISGEEVAFDVNASGEALSAAVTKVKNWWQQKRLGEDESTSPVASSDIEAPESEKATFVGAVAEEPVVEAATVEPVEAVAAEETTSIQVAEGSEEPEALSRDLGLGPEPFRMETEDEAGEKTVGDVEKESVQDPDNIGS